jgi:hypothetical protein
LGIDAVHPEEITDMTAYIIAHIKRVRQLPGMATARAILVGEANEPFVIGQVYLNLRQANAPNVYLLNLDSTTARGTKRNAEGAELQRGDMSPGIMTTQANKGLGMEMIGRFLRESRFHLHRDFVHYTINDTGDEMRTAAEHEFDMTKIREAFHLPPGEGSLAGPGGLATAVHSVLREAEKERLERLLYKELGWMKRLITNRTKANGEVQTTVRLTGKGGRDPDDGSERRDDLVMGLVMVLLGAAGFYTHRNFFEERRRLGLPG